MSDTDGSRAAARSDWLLADNRLRPRPETLDLAMDAWGRGQSTLAAGDLPAARYWAERALRLGPRDTQVRFLLGIVLLRQRDRAAFEAFRQLVALSDTVPAHRGLLAAAALIHDHDTLTRIAATLLARFAPPTDTEFPALAARAAAAAGLPGWCGADAAGRITVSAAGAVRFALDDRAIAVRRRPDGRWSLPRSWATSETLTVTADGHPLLGSPIDLARRRMVEGFVEAASGDLAGGLSGWAWCPADPEATVTLTLAAAHGRRLPMTVDPQGPAQFPNMDGLTAPKAFHVPADRLLDRTGLLHLRDSAGRDLIGSPVDPGLWTGAATAAGQLMAERAAARTGRRPPQPKPPAILPIWADTPRPARKTKPRRVRQGPAVVVPVYRGAETTLRCLARVLETVPARTPVIVVDDAGPEPDLSAALDALARRRRIRLIRNPRNLGFPASANIGMAAAGGMRDVVLLNSDTIVPPGWLERLRDAVWSAPDIGTVTPLSNDATILSYPRVGNAQPPPDGEMLDRIDRMAARVNAGRLVDIPTGVGFCMYIRGDCLGETGLFREDVFAQGYGEENDFCLRARHLGWRHVAAPGVFVGHIGGQSFRATRDHLLRRNLRLLERLHPGYHDLIAEHVAADPVAEARRRLDLARWRGLRATPVKAGAAVILITHDEGGGVERQIGIRARALMAQGLRPIILRPDGDGGCRVEPADEVTDIWRSGFPNLRYRIPEQLSDLAALLRRDRPDHVELHHQLGHHHDLLSLPALLGVPMDVFVHDYAAICPRVTLVTTSNRYCGEPEARQCEACIADLGSRLREDISVTALRRRTTADLAAARKVVFPSADAETRLRRYVPGLRHEITPWEAETPHLTTNRGKPAAGRRRRVAIIGAIGTEKGYDVILDCARDAARRDLPLEFVVIGYTHDDLRLMDTGRARITYRFAPEKAVAEIRAQNADIAFIPSIWPETWCFALSDAWAAGLKTAVFDIGTQAERVRATHNGWVLPLALPPIAINNTLIALAET
jgi:GT2 family glycosyltransferase/glycosyltransferase involved in cell wall biosynthesis